ncbi:MAG: substrate-binding domain-containing protein [Chloroflexi bacterium]|nr:substrate-binding domain-containing protein [Chloroflexota bacterium]
MNASRPERARRDDTTVDRLTTVAGLGPHGEFPAPADQLQLTARHVAIAREARYTVAVVVHSLGSDWSRLQLRGILSTLETYGAEVIEVVDCDFVPQRQIETLETLVARRPDAIISIPVDNVLTADAHRLVAEAGIKLVLMDNVPLGLVPRKDYVSLVSADNFGNGQVAAEILSPYVPGGGTAGIIGFGVDYFVTNEREIAFRKWMRERRPDVTLRHAEFKDVAAAGRVALEFLSAHPEAAALFVAWDEPAMAVASALEAGGRSVPITTVDLGNEVAVSLARGGPVKGLGAQQPYDQGVAEAIATILALVGDEPPPWVALPALSVTRRNVIAAYEAVWHASPPLDLIAAAKTGT